MEEYIEYLITRHRQEYKEFLKKNPIKKFDFSVKKCLPQEKKFCLVLELDESKDFLKIPFRKEETIKISNKIHGYIVDIGKNTLTCYTDKFLQPKLQVSVERHDQNYKKTLIEIKFIRVFKKIINQSVWESISQDFRFGAHASKRKSSESNHIDINIQEDKILEEVYKIYVDTGVVDLEIRFQDSFYDKDFNKTLYRSEIYNGVSEKTKESNLTVLDPFLGDLNKLFGGLSLKNSLKLDNNKFVLNIITNLSKENIVDKAIKKNKETNGRNILSENDTDSQNKNDKNIGNATLKKNFKNQANALVKKKK
ncbi:hypothetical protein EDEG_02076 [Edhazardia aedis USNM 41457]|uniref:Uncharacterized protein n=1 Tax=Edhazardia aedis (strain USNM 41457) TaxID=1003232 RepID=J8ZVE7_EDHAE|nr:hypothetical protein EDEG_02076 [Edhazardia aedis USNM 41457]|eukprot:EJW03608.1 hypothetical protein EDEG_02076 [Edhazardia aedis USNM 41457]